MAELPPSTFPLFHRVKYYIIRNGSRFSPGQGIFPPIREVLCSLPSQLVK